MKSKDIPFSLSLESLPLFRSITGMGSIAHSLPPPKQDTARSLGGISIAIQAKTSILRRMEEAASKRTFK